MMALIIRNFGERDRPGRIRRRPAGGTTNCNSGL